MPNKTAIGWTDFSSSPVRYRDQTGAEVWACVHVSPGCENCYAEALALRFHRGSPFTAGNIMRVETFLDEVELAKLRKSSALSGKRVFLEDMSDLFGQWVPNFSHIELWDVMAERSDVTWQILTKRPERMRAALDVVQDSWISAKRWPLPNVWLGVSTEDQRTADQRIPELLRCDAAVHWISAEPLLGDLDLGRYLAPDMTVCRGDRTVPLSLPTIRSLNQVARWGYRQMGGNLLDWIVVGGESGPQARPTHPRWVEHVVIDAALADVPVYFKQWGAYAPPHPGTKGTHLVQLDGTLVSRSDGGVVVDNPYGERSGLQQDFVDRGHPGWARVRKTSGRPGGDAKIGGRVYHEFPEQLRSFSGTVE